MKFTIPFNMPAFLVTARKSEPTPDSGAFVWGYRASSPIVFTGIYKAIHQECGRTYYTIDLLDGGRIDVDGIVAIPNQFLPYVVARDNKVHRVKFVDCRTLTTTHGRAFTYDEVQPVLYHDYGLKAMAKEPSKPDLPNRVRDEGV